MPDQGLIEKMAKRAGFKPIMRGAYWSYVWYPDGSLRGKLPDFPNDLNACFKHLIPLSGMDSLWIIHNPEGISYAFGHSRGEMNDVVCWSKTLPIEECLSPICDEAATAICQAIDKLIDSEVANAQSTKQKDR